MRSAVLIALIAVLATAMAQDPLRAVVFATDNYYPMVANSTATDFTGE
jgi:hypothetical protein